MIASQCVHPAGCAVGQSHAQVLQMGLGSMRQLVQQTSLLATILSVMSLLTVVPPGFAGPFRLKANFGYRERHALVVGINRYPSERFDDLNGPCFDAAEVAAVLASRFGFENVTLLIDQEPGFPVPTSDRLQISIVDEVSAGTVRDAIESLTDDVESDDGLLLYFAGHGIRLKTKGYLACSGSDPEQPETMIGLDHVASVLRSCGAHHTLMILDSCFSGVVLEDASGVRESVGVLAEPTLRYAGSDNLSRVFSRRSFQIITAGTGNEPVGDLAQLSKEYADLAAALPEFQGHSPFTAVLLQGMRGLTGRPDGVLLASDLGYYMNHVLVNDKRFGARQAPRYGEWGQGNGDFTFIPARPVLNPKLVSPLYQTGDEYADLRAAACYALGTFIGKQNSRTTRLSLSTSSLPHLVRLLRDNDPEERTKSAATQVLAELGGEFAREIPEFSSVVGPVSQVLGESRNQDLRRISALALGRLAPHATSGAVRTMREYVRDLRESWRKTARGRFVPRAVRSKQRMVDETRLDERAGPADQMATLDLKRHDLEWLHTEGMARVVEFEQKREAIVSKVLEAQRLSTEGDWYEAGTRYADAWSEFQALDVSPFLAEVGLWQFFQHCPPPLNELRGHTASISSVAFSPDGRSAVSGGADHLLRLWDVATARELKTFSGHTSDVWSVAFSRDGRQIISGGQDATVRTWDTMTGRLLHTLTGHDTTVLGVAVSPDGSHIASCDADGGLRIWDLMQGEEVKRLDGHSNCAWSVTFAGDGDVLVSGAASGNVALWNWKPGEQLQAFRAPGVVTCVAISPDGTTIAAGGGLKDEQLTQSAVFEAGVNMSEGARGFLVLWDRETGKEVQTLSGYRGWIRSIAFTPDGRHLISGGSDKTARLWDVSANRELRRYEGYHAGRVFGVAVSRDGQLALTASLDGTAMVWPLRDRNVQNLIPLARSVYSSEIVFRVAFGPRGRFALAGGGFRGRTGIEQTRLGVWDISTGNLLRRIDGGNAMVLDPDDRGTGWITGLAVSPDGRYVLVGAGRARNEQDKVPRILNLTTGKPERSLPAHRDAIHAAAFTPNGQLLVTGCEDKAARVFDTASGKELSRYLEHFSGVSRVAVTPDGSRVLSGGSNGSLKFWDIHTAEDIFEMAGHRDHVTAIAIAPDGSAAVTAASNLISLQGGPVRVEMKLWDLTDGQEIRTFRDGHQGPINGLSLSPDGHWVVTAGEDRTIKLWEVASGRPFFTFTGFPGSAEDVCFSPSGDAVIAGSQDERLQGGFLAPLIKQYHPTTPVVDPACLKVWHFGRVRTYIEQVLLEKATENRAALRNDENDAAALASLGQWYAFHGQWELARELLRKAHDLQPTNELSQQLASLEWQAGDLTAAAALLVDARQDNDAEDVYLHLRRSVVSQGLLARGRELSKQGRHDAAIDAYSHALKLDPENDDLCFQRGYSHAVIGEQKKSLADYDRAISINPDHVWVRNNRGHGFAQAGKFAEAIVDYDVAVRLNPDNVMHRTNRASALMNMKQFDKAMSDLQHAETLEPEDAGIQNRMGLVLREKGDYDGAVGYFDRAIELDPDLGYLYVNRGYALSSNKKYAAAIEAFQQLRARYPKDAWSAYHLACVHALHAENMEESRGEQKKAALDQLNEACLLGFTDLDRLQQDDLLSAVCDDARFERIVKFCKSRKFFGEGERHQADAQYVDAVAAFSKSMECDPTFIDACIRRAACHEALKETGPAIEDCSMALAIESDRADVLVMRGRLHRLPGKLDSAEADYSKAIELAREAPDPHIGRGYVRLAQGSIEEAMSDFRQARELAPDNPVGSFHLACAFAQRASHHPAEAVAANARQQDIDKALELLESAVENGLKDLGLIKSARQLDVLIPETRYQRLIEGR